jgi:LPS-assembly lipoprotein
MAAVKVRSWLRCGLALALCVTLAGCLRPLYGAPAAGGTDVALALSSVEVDPIPDHIGHQLRNDLIFALTGGNPVPGTRYRLGVTVSRAINATVVDTATGRADAANVILRANYTLVEVAGGKPVTSGRAEAFVSYDRTAQRFASVRASRDAEIRGARVLSDQIRTRLAAHFAQAGG